MGNPSWCIDIVGESFEDRQYYINQLENGEPLILTSEPDNPFDKNAVAVLTQDGNKIGYLSKADAKSYINQLKKCRLKKCYVNWVGGKERKGVTIIIDFSQRFPLLEEKLLELLKDGSFLSAKQIKEKINDQDIISVVYSMFDAGELRRIGEGKRGNPYRWGIHDPQFEPLTLQP